MNEKTLEYMIKNGDGKLSDYEYYLKCGTRVFPRVILSPIKFLQLSPIKFFLQRGYTDEMYISGMIYLKEDIDFESIRELLNNDFELVGVKVEILRGGRKVSINRKANEIFVKEAKA